MARVGPHQNDDWFHCQEALTYREEPRVYECLFGCGTRSKKLNAPLRPLWIISKREFRGDVFEALVGHLRGA